MISYVRYLGNALWPSKLVALYPHPTKLYPAWQVGAAVLLLLLVTALVLRARDQRYLAVGWFWFLGSLVPMIGLVQVGLRQWPIASRTFPSLAVSDVDLAGGRLGQSSRDFAPHGLPFPLFLVCWCWEPSLTVRLATGTILSPSGSARWRSRRQLRRRRQLGRLSAQAGPNRRGRRALPRRTRHPSRRSDCQPESWRL